MNDKWAQNVQNMKRMVTRNRPVRMFPNQPQGISEAIRLFLTNGFIKVTLIGTKIIMVRYTTDIKLIQKTVS